MADYDLYYWPVPFRGQFIRAILAFANRSWTEHGSDEIGDLMSADARDQPLPFMGPPLLVENDGGFVIAQMPAIALYLGETLGLVPATAQGRALTAKVVNDANDVIDEITLDGGREMWTKEKWADFVPRLERWMSFWEATASTSGATAGAGYLLGTPGAGVADVVTATLWSTMGERFPAIGTMLDETAPVTAGLVRRMQAIPALAKLSDKAFDDYGDSYAGGEIGKSMSRFIE